MRKLIAMLLMLLATVGYADPLLDRLLPALEQQESRGDPYAYNARENAAGILQIRPIMVRDLNRLAGYEKYHLDDRFKPAVARQMCREYLTHYSRPARLNKQPSLKDLARIWVGGPDGYKKASSKEYWDQVRKRLEAQL